MTFYLQTAPLGQTTVTNLISATKTVTKQNKDGSWSFIIPRSFNGGTIIGGTKETGDWRVEPSLETRERLIKAAQDIIPLACDSSLGSVKPEDVEVLADVVGRRPARYGGMRLEVESKSSVKGGKQNVIHAYGAGGRGYELSWGIATEVADLAKTLSPFTTTVKSKL